MKRLLALLLVLCMMAGMLACGKPADSAGGTTPGGDNKETTEESKETTPIRDDISNIEEDDLAIKSEADNSNAAYINPEKFAGKKLQIAGLNGDSFNDLDNMGKGTYNWMIRAAIADWAALNQVEVTFECGYSSTDILSAVNSGTKLDLMFGANAHGELCNQGITQGFTKEQYDEIVKICGPKFVDCLNYKGASYGVIYPWTGNTLIYYNRTMFEQYGAKTPAEYFMEDNWNWSTFETVLESVTRDFNGNGKMDENDTFGIGATIKHISPPATSQDPVTGKVTGIIGTNPMYKVYLDLMYKGRWQTLSVAQKGTHYITTTSTPRCLVMAGDCEWYNFEHLYKTLENGDVIEVTIPPEYTVGDIKQHVKFTSRFMSLLSSCDEPEAAFSLLCYVLKVGLRYISDFSCGLYKNEYDGIQGASEWSKGWKEKFEAICEDRRAAFAEIEDWNQEHYEKMIKKMFAEDTYVTGAAAYTGSVSKVSVTNLPSASAIPLLVAEQDAWIAKYNELYAN